MKEGAKRSCGEEGNKFRQRRVGQTYQDPELILCHSPGMSTSVTLKRFMVMASPSDLRGCQDSWWQAMLIKYTRNSAGQKVNVNDRTVRLQVFIYQMPRMSTLLYSGLSHTDVRLCAWSILELCSARSVQLYMTTPTYIKAGENRHRNKSHI